MPASLLAVARTLRALALLLVLVLCASSAFAHKSSDAYLQLSRSGDGLVLRWDISLRDLDAVLELDQNDDLKLTWGEVRAHLADIRAYALSHLSVSSAGACSLVESSAPALEQRVDGGYLVLQMHSSCAIGPRVTIDYRLFREVDPTHRGILRIAMAAGAAPVLLSLDPVAGARLGGRAGRPRPSAALPSRELTPMARPMRLHAFSLLLPALSSSSSTACITS